MRRLYEEGKRSCKSRDRPSQENLRQRQWSLIWRIRSHWRKLREIDVRPNRHSIIGINCPGCTANKHFLAVGTWAGREFSLFGASKAFLPECCRLKNSQTSFCAIGSSYLCCVEHSTRLCKTFEVLEVTGSSVSQVCSGKKMHDSWSGANRFFWNIVGSTKIRCFMLFWACRGDHSWKRVASSVSLHV